MTDDWFTPEETPAVDRMAARLHVTQMRKPELVAEALRLRLGPSRSALDVHSRGALLRMVLDAMRARDVPR